MTGNRYVNNRLIEDSDAGIRLWNRLPCIRPEELRGMKDKLIDSEGHEYYGVVVESFGWDFGWLEDED